MVTFIRVSGRTENPTARATTFITETKVCIREIGRTERNKDLESLLLMISMGTLDNGNRTRKMAEGPTFILTARDMKEAGLKIRKKAEECIGIETGIFTMAVGRMTVGKGKGQ